MVRHGGCLGLGLAAMGTHRQDVYEQLKFNLYQDDANTGEAAGIAMGMVMLGSKNASAIEDMVAVSDWSFFSTITTFLFRGYSLPVFFFFYGFRARFLSNFQSVIYDRSYMGGNQIYNFIFILELKNKWFFPF